MTAMAGAGVYLDMMAAAGLWESVRRHVGIKGMSQGWTDIQMITSLVLLNVAGGESVSDLNVLEGDKAYQPQDVTHFHPPIALRIRATRTPNPLATG